MSKISLKNLKPGTIFKVIDDFKFDEGKYSSRDGVTRKTQRNIYVEEWFAIVDGELPGLYIYCILFKHLKRIDGITSSELKDGEFKIVTLSKDVYDGEPPSSLEVIEDKELRMIVSPDGIRAKLVNKDDSKKR